MRRCIRRPVLFYSRKPGRGLPIPALTVCADLITYDLNHNVCVVVDVSQFLPPDDTILQIGWTMEDP